MISTKNEKRESNTDSFVSFAQKEKMIRHKIDVSWYHSKSAYQSLNRSATSRKVDFTPVRKSVYISKENLNNSKNWSSNRPSYIKKFGVQNKPALEKSFTLGSNATPRGESQPKITVYARYANTNKKSVNARIFSLKKTKLNTNRSTSSISKNSDRPCSNFSKF